jgi:hypothetical protein
MNTSEHYTQARKKLSPERAAVEYTSVGASNDPTSVTAAQLDILQNTHSTCSTQNSPQILNQLRHSTHDISYSSSQKLQTELETLIDIYPCLTGDDKQQAIKRINEVSSQLQTFINKNNPDPVDPEHNIFCKNENALYFEHNKVATACPIQTSRPIFPDPAINPQAKVATNRLVKPYSATIFTQMEKNKNIGRTYDKTKKQKCPRFSPKIECNPINYNEKIYLDLNNNIKNHCFKKDFPNVNPVERNLSINPNTFYKNFVQYQPTTMGQRIQIETAIKKQGTEVFDQMNDTIIESLPPVKQTKLCGYNQ